MRRIWHRLPLLGLVWGTFAAVLPAADQPPAPPAGQKVLIVGTHEAPPFAMPDGKGGWTGLSIDLWREAADQLGLRYEFRAMPTPDSLIDGIAAGQLDASIAAITVTAARAGKVDFTQPFYNTGLGIVVPATGDHGWWRVMRAFFSVDFLKVVVALFLVLLAAGLGVWLFERRKNSEQFGGTAASGLGSSFWWAAVTMTTVGYGDKSPRTFGGRTIALLWMFISVIIISGFTAQITSSLTVGRLDTAIKGPSDLPRFAIATVEGSIAARYLRANDVTVMPRATIEEAIAAVKDGQADGCVYDAAILQYALRRDRSLELLPARFDLRDYAIAVPLDSPLRKQLNLVLLRIEQGDLWPLMRQRYFGKSG